MNIVHEKPSTDNNQLDTQEPQGCMLGHELGNCPAGRAGCGNHLAMLNFMFPPLTVLIHVRETMSGDPSVRRWLANVDAVLPGRPTFSTRRGW
jgi:hypothetical protein